MIRSQLLYPLIYRSIYIIATLGGLEPLTVAVKVRCATNYTIGQYLATPIGIEPIYAESESAMLPLHHEASFNFSYAEGFLPYPPE